VEPMESEVVNDAEGEVEEGRRRKKDRREEA
jgi:hypothetical protein